MASPQGLASLTFLVTSRQYVYQPNPHFYKWEIARRGFEPLIFALKGRRVNRYTNGPEGLRFRFLIL